MTWGCGLAARLYLVGRHREYASRERRTPVRPVPRCPGAPKGESPDCDMIRSSIRCGRAGARRRVAVVHAEGGRSEERDDTTELEKLIRASVLRRRIATSEDVPPVSRSMTRVSASSYWERWPGLQPGKRSWRARLRERPVSALPFLLSEGRAADLWKVGADGTVPSGEPPSGSKGGRHED